MAFRLYIVLSSLYQFPHCISIAYIIKPLMTWADNLHLTFISFMTSLILMFSGSNLLTRRGFFRLMPNPSFFTTMKASTRHFKYQSNFFTNNTLPFNIIADLKWWFLSDSYWIQIVAMAYTQENTIF